MNDLKFASRWLAVLIIAQLVLGPFTNFTLLEPVFQGAGGFLANASPNATALSSAALLSIALAVASSGTALLLWPVLKPLSERMALSLAILCTAGVALAGLEHVSLLSMLSLSQAYVAAGSPDEALYQGLRGVVSAQRNWAHLTQLLVAGATLLAMYASFYRFRLVPRWLAAIGILACVSQMIAVAKPVYGGWVVFAMLAPLGIAQLLLLGWLLVKGLRTPEVTAG
jgi:hypothetical protein